MAIISIVIQAIAQNITDVFTVVLHINKSPISHVHLAFYSIHKSSLVIGLQMSNAKFQFNLFNSLVLKKIYLFT